MRLVYNTVGSDSRNCIFVGVNLGNSYILHFSKVMANKVISNSMGGGRHEFHPLELVGADDAGDADDDDDGDDEGDDDAG